jgi:hypothetical protein
MTFSSARLFGCRTADKMWDQERERLLGPSSSVRPVSMPNARVQARSWGFVCCVNSRRGVVQTKVTLT